MPHIDRSLRLPLLLALLMVGGFVGSRYIADRDLGYRDYGDNCGICHHGGTGQAGETPPLFGRVDKIAATPDGRTYIMSVLLNGLNGPIVASGARYDFSMPSFAQLDDATIARILTYVSHQGASTAVPAFTAADIARTRRNPMPSWRVHELRERLDARLPLP